MTERLRLPGRDSSGRALGPIGTALDHLLADEEVRP
jgi:hypothetical protein